MKVICVGKVKKKKKLRLFQGQISQNFQNHNAQSFTILIKKFACSLKYFP